MESAIGNSVLVIDDDDESIEKIKRNLLQCEDEIEIAQSGQEGLKLAEDGTPDLVILNLSLPDMDGWTVFGRLKAMPDFWDVPIILTDRSRTPDYAHAQAVGAAGYLLKPYTADQLLAARSAVLKGETYYPALPGGKR